jgi:hypothetical protein
MIANPHLPHKFEPPKKKKKKKNTGGGGAGLREVSEGGREGGRERGKEGERERKGASVDEVVL